MKHLQLKFNGHRKVYLHREHLVNSLEGRKMEFLTISSHLGLTDTPEKHFQKSSLFPNKKQKRALRFDESLKKYVMITARVHPGETPGSHAMNGIIKFLLFSKDKRARILLDHFVFVLVPMLNPDGVYRGHYRVDTMGNNLNRFYQNPNIINQPTIYAAKQLFMKLH